MEQFKGSLDAPKKNNEREQEEINHMNVNVKVKKASKAKGLFKILFSKDIFSAVKDAIFDVAVPNLKDNMAKTSKSVIDQMFYDAPTRSNTTGFINYGSSYQIPAQKAINTVTSQTRINQRRSIYDVNNVTFEDLNDKRDPKTGEIYRGILSVIDELQSMCRQYGLVTVGQFYDVINYPSMNYLDQRYGWTNLEGLTYSRNANGYIINFPRVEVIDDIK